MANHRSALKRIRQTASHTKRNTDRISRIKTFIKRFIASVGSSDAEKAFSAAQSEIHRGVSKGVLHKNAASRKVARLNKLLKKSA